MTRVCDPNMGNKVPHTEICGQHNVRTSKHVVLHLSESVHIGEYGFNIKWQLNRIGNHFMGLNIIVPKVDYTIWSYMCRLLPHNFVLMSCCVQISLIH